MQRSPRYLTLLESGELAERAAILEDLLEECTLCPNRCRVNRKAGRKGACGVGAENEVASITIHPWEEPPISGTGGSGTVFYSGCTMECLFCQNYPISQMGVGRILTDEQMAAEMLKLQGRGAHNINLVTPTHQVPGFVRALLLAVPRGLSLPVVYNTSGYEEVETLRLLEGIVDIYLPDIKYSRADAARFCSGRASYVEVNRRAISEMWRQVGPLALDSRGIAWRGMLVRHMVLPEGLSGTRECMAFLARTIGPEAWVSLMSQYFPAHKALQPPPLHRKATREEYEDAFRSLVELGLSKGFVQEHSGEDEVECDKEKIKEE